MNLLHETTVIGWGVLAIGLGLLLAYARATGRRAGAHSGAELR